MNIQTRQNRHGAWWCNGTIAPFGDQSFEAQTPEAAQSLMRDFLERHKIDQTNIKWSEPTTYQTGRKLSADAFRAQSTILTH